MKILKNVELYKPKYKGKKDILIGGGKILMISNKIEPISGVEQLDLKDKIMTPGFIDQHIHITHESFSIYGKNLVANIWSFNCCI